MEVELDNSDASNDLSIEENIRRAHSASSAHTPEYVLAAYQRVMQAVTNTNRYLPDMKHKGWKLGQGGCFTTVERFEHWTCQKFLFNAVDV